MDKSTIEESLRQRFTLLAPHLDERTRRLWAANEAEALGHGGVALVARATGLSTTVIGNGKGELRGEPLVGRVRREGGGRKRAEATDPTLWEDLEALVAPTTRGDPESPLMWTNKSTRALARALVEKGHKVGDKKVGRLLKEHGYSLQGTRKTLEGASHEDRDAQFQHINDEVRRFQAMGQPVISVDTKKKELVGPYSNAGQEWHPKGEPPKVNVHDFPDPERGKAVPYGIYDVDRNEAWVNVGTSSDTPQFAVQAIRTWWMNMGQQAYPEATDLLVTADCGGSNGYRVRMWKVELQRLATELGITISVCHYPPGTSKWNKIEHRLFCHITRNWRGRPLESYDTVVSLIGSTSTTTGLRVEAQLDAATYEKGIKPTTEQMEALDIERDEFHGEWNYTVLPQVE